MIVLLTNYQKVQHASLLFFSIPWTNSFLPHFCYSPAPDEDCFPKEIRGSPYSAASPQFIFRRSFYNLGTVLRLFGLHSFKIERVADFLLGLFLTIFHFNSFGDTSRWTWNIFFGDSDFDSFSLNFSPWFSSPRPALRLLAPSSFFRHPVYFMFRFCCASSLFWIYCSICPISSPPLRRRCYLYQAESVHLLSRSQARHLMRIPD